MEPVEYKFEIKKATLEDVPRVFELVRELADCQGLLHKFSGSVSDLEKWTFGENKILFIYCGWITPLCDNNENVVSTIIGYTLHFLNYSTFYHKPGIYLEDIYVQSKYRGKGYGKNLILHLCKIAKDNGFDIVEWQVLDSNESSIKFYESLGAKTMKEWVQYRLSGESTKQCAIQFSELINK